MWAFGDSCTTVSHSRQRGLERLPYRPFIMTADVGKQEHAACSWQELDGALLRVCCGLRPQASRKPKINPCSCQDTEITHSHAVLTYREALLETGRCGEFCFSAVYAFERVQFPPNERFGHIGSVVWKDRADYTVPTYGLVRCQMSSVLLKKGIAHEASLAMPWGVL
ncbi:hypothetical protein EJ03DRAFT_71439 [Teratosphaeria nubilosa]|uniref:Uncharacterized protein n=1 Tax=Teratosphaeria nubilosa TaxID=161662 RepID=A0A6G1LM01_9PEZI|nr:hypothetical protein EJ03DRAFT_71439 [Teratosphaeria nubilosa]